MADTLQDLLASQGDNINQDIPEETIVDLGGSPSVFMPTSKEEESLLSEDFPKYTPKERAVISQISSLLADSESAGLFAQKEDDRELSAFENRILKLIEKA